MISNEKNVLLRCSVSAAQQGRKMLFVRQCSSNINFEKMIKNNKVVVFMKGSPDKPRCGFSNTVVQILRMHNVTSCDYHDVLEDPDIREGIKKHTNWPTIPQVFINGVFIGGSDIIFEMHHNGEFIKHLEIAGIKSALLDKSGVDAKKEQGEEAGGIEKAK